MIGALLIAACFVALVIVIRLDPAGLAKPKGR